MLFRKSTLNLLDARKRMEVSRNSDFIISGGEIEEDFTGGARSLGELLLGNLELGGDNVIYVSS
jgi:hypothetical protein